MLTEYDNFIILSKLLKLFDLKQFDHPNDDAQTNATYERILEKMGESEYGLCAALCLL